MKHLLTLIRILLIPLWLLIYVTLFATYCIKHFDHQEFCDYYLSKVLRLRKFLKL